MTHLAAFVTAADLHALEGLLALDSLSRVTLITPKPVYLIHPKLFQLTSLNQHWGNYDWLKSVYDFFRHAPPDAIYGAGSRLNWFWAGMIGQQIQRPYILTLENNALLSPLRFWQALLTRADVVTYPYPWLTGYASGSLAPFEDQVMILPPFKTFPPYAPQARTFEAVYPLYAETWDELAVDVWWHVVAKVPQARLVMVGQSSPKLTELINRVRLRDHILLSEGDIGDWLKVSQLYFAWDTDAGVPEIAMQAMANGTIPVHGRDGMIDYLVETGKNGILFDNPQETRAIAKAISHLLNDPVYYSQVQAATLRLPHMFSLSAITEAWTDILAHVQRV